MGCCLFQLIVLFISDFNCSGSFVFYWVDRFTTGIWSFVSVITQFFNEVSCRLTSQLIKGISSVIQKLFRCFDGITISTSFALPTAVDFYIILALILNDSKAVMLSFATPLLYWHKLPDVFLYNYCCTLLDYTSA